VDAVRHLAPCEFGIGAVALRDLGADYVVNAGLCGMFLIAQ